ncbi:recombinase family protein [Caulobacter segnis]|uniref:Resolvase/invertase-type recombinase catalytic domain-containing protein n=1 Tax=Caulobacter segnis TaxID=88688 RepID=A0A2W5UY79_9CAUL|nr:recombinase family protein [Caulobacter segnis]PZR32610.1 MAG: hypothetical protein DI526_16185 [Caulobacter segnis]
MSANVLIYRRFSTDEQEQGDTLTRQSRMCEQFAQGKGWSVTGTLTDRGKSAFKGEHLLPDAELGQFAAKVERGEIPRGTVLLAERLDRLSRRPVQEAMAWIHGITSKGVQIALADTGQVFTANPTIETFLGTAIRAAQNHEESAKKSQRMISAKTRLWNLAERKQGAWTNLAGRVPLWLERNAECNGWIENDERIKIVNDIFQWSADGIGAVTIAKRLNEIPVEPWGVWRKKPGWGRTAIRQLINNPAVEGDFVPEAGMFLGKVLHGFYPRIVDADLVAKARAAEKSRKHTKGQRAKSGYSNLFAGLTFCGKCGNTAYLSSSTNRKGVKYTYIRCQISGEGRCEERGYFAYEAFEQTALDICLDLAMDDRFFQVTGELREAQIKRAELEKVIADKRARRKRIMSNFDEDDQDALDMARDLKTEIDGLTEELQQTIGDIERASGKVGAVEHLRRVNDIREAAMSDDPLVSQQARSKLRQAFSAIINSVRIERTNDGEKVFVIAFLGGVLGVRIDTQGQVIDSVSHALGKPLWQHLPADQQALAEPLIRRIKEHLIFPRKSGRG